MEPACDDATLYMRAALDAIEEGAKLRAENEKLRALLTEARERLMRTFGYGMDVDGNLASRIDAALKVEG